MKKVFKKKESTRMTRVFNFARVFSNIMFMDVKQRVCTYHRVILLLVHSLYCINNCFNKRACPLSRMGLANTLARFQEFVCSGTAMLMSSLISPNRIKGNSTCEDSMGK